jgi:ketosteroid isomerase-like protein
MKRRAMILAGMGILPLRAQVAANAGDAREQVRKAERGFAASMAQRDHGRFMSFLSDEAVFIAKENEPALRGKRAVAEGWKPFFDGPGAPFSWDPDLVEVLNSGKLALSTGPVKNPKGELAGRFTSIWRLENDGQWRVVFDRGCPACKCG